MRRHPFYFRASSDDFKRLKAAERQTWGMHHKPRTDWLEIYYLSGAWEDFRNNGDDVYALYGMSERTVDTCGEMNDGEDVIADLLRRADFNPKLLAAITEAHGESCLSHWRECARYARQPSLF